MYLLLSLKCMSSNYLKVRICPFTLLFEPLLISNPKIIQILLILVLRSQAGICQIAFFVVPFLQSTIIEHFQIVLNDKWNDIVFQTLLKNNQSAHTPITILERMDSLKLHMKALAFSI